MPLIRINMFRGQVPRLAPRKLGNSFSQIARNCDLWSREIRPLRNNLQVNTPTKNGTILSIYPLNGKWLHWASDVDVVRSPLQTANQDGRVYYSGDKNLKATNNTLATTGGGTDYPLDWYRVGLPPPETAPTIGATGGASGIPEVRSYVYTWVTPWGEEGPPSAATEYTSPNDDATSWDISGLDAYPLNTGSISAATHASGEVTVTVTAPHHLETGDYVDISGVVGMTDLNASGWQITRISGTQFKVTLTTAQTYTSGGTWSRESKIQTTGMTKRLYRTVSGTLKFVAELAAGATTYTDITADADLGEPLPSATWISPPPDINGLISLPNGAMAGFYRNVLAMSEPYKPHAWPAGYEISFPFQIVGIAAFGSSVVVATDGDPYLVTGYHPSTMSDLRLNIHQACVSKRSVKAVLNGVIYASPDGLVYVPGAGAPRIITREWMKKPDWDKYNPPSLHAEVYDDRYYGFYSGGGSNGNEAGAIVFDPGENDSTFTEVDLIATATHIEPDSDEFYLMAGQNIEQWGQGGGFKVFTWRSGIFTLPRPVSMKAAKVRLTFGDGISEADYQATLVAAVQSVDSQVSAGTEIHTGALGGFMAGQYPVAGGPYLDAVNETGGPYIPGQLSGIAISAKMTVYRNGALYDSRDISDSTPFRLPGGERDDQWEIEISGDNIIVHEVMIATTMAELARA